MERILVSQNENNNGTDYLIVNGLLLKDEDSVVKYGRILSKTDQWEELYKDEFLEIRKNDKKLVFKSFYYDKDIVGRSIYYLYIIEKEQENYEQILEQLREDSFIIERTFDKDRVLELISRMENNNSAKKKINQYLIIGIGIAFLIYLLTKIK